MSCIDEYNYNVHYAMGKTYTKVLVRGDVSEHSSYQLSSQPAALTGQQLLIAHNNGKSHNVIQPCFIHKCSHWMEASLSQASKLFPSLSLSLSLSLSFSLTHTHPYTTAYLKYT